MSDIFGDLREWGQVLKQIEQLRLAGQLDEHQQGLIRVLRYRCNWQLRQVSLRAAPDLSRPSDELFGLLLEIVSDEDCGLETRLLACDAVRHLLHKQSGREDARALESRAFEHAGRILEVSQPPVLREAVERWLVVRQEPLEQVALA